MTVSSLPLVIKQPLETCEVCVILPARDESARIERCLLALAQQTDFLGAAIDAGRYEVIVLANNCRDDTAALARAIGRRHPNLVLHVVEKQFSPEKSFVGCARKLLMDEACRRLVLLKRPDGIIASTDADTYVEPTWVSGIVREIAGGADAVGGRILADPSERLLLHPFAERTYLRQVMHGFLLAELEHLIDPDPFDTFPRHPNHNGASLAVTASTYLRIGGLPDIREEEDSALYKAILLSGARFRHSLEVRATTSARLDGRVKHGFSAGLKQFCALERTSASLLVENPSANEIRLRGRRMLRILRRELQLKRGLKDLHLQIAGRLLRIPTSWLSREILKPQSLNRLMDRVDYRQTVEGDWEQLWPQMFLDEAIAELRLRLSYLRKHPENDFTPQGSFVSAPETMAHQSRH
jgi:hypothetical protein